MKYRIWWKTWQTMPKRRRRKILALTAIIVLGVGLRVYQFPTYPAGLNQDEISAAYESYSLVTTGKDRWGEPWPAYFLGWGSGQNVLQSYLSLPALWLFGLTPLSVRLVPLILGILTLPLLFWAVRRSAGTSVALVATLILAVCPWHVLLSRWGLESNILPFFLLLGIATFDIALRAPRAKSWRILPALMPFAIGCYAYGTAAVVIPLLAVGMLALHYRTVVARWRWWLGAAVIAAVIALPFCLFVVKNYVVHTALSVEQLLPVSIPLLQESRLDQIRGQVLDADILSPGDPIYNVIFVGNGLTDHTVYNVVGAFLPLPIGVLFFALAGIGITMRDAVRSRLRIVSPFLLWAGAASCLFFVAALNVNQANALFIPLVVLAAIAIIRSAQAFPRQYSRVFVGLVCGYVVVSGAAAYWQYFSPSNASAMATTYHPELSRAFEVVQTKVSSDAPLYISDSIALNYVQTLFYTHTRPSVFQASAATVANPDFGRYRFSLKRIAADESFVYLANMHDEIPCIRTTTLWQDGDWVIRRCDR